jgi:Pyridine nucleotide-disulphide oxidoreductase
VLGAGYTGMTAALGVARRTRRRDDVHIRLVNPDTRFTERLRLHQVASGQELADLQIPDMLAGTGVEFVQGWVTAIDADKHTVRVDDEQTLHYDTLVYAMGAVADTDAVPGADQHAFTLNSRQEAELLAATLKATNRPRFAEDRAKTAQATERFFAAATGDDINALMELLAPDVTLWTDGGGKVRQAMRPIEGADKVAAWFIGAARRPYEGVSLSDMTASVAEINGSPGLVFEGGGRIITVLTVELDAGGEVATIRAVANPDKLRDVISGRRRDVGAHRLS